MTDVDLSKYNRINKEMNDNIMDYIKSRGFFRSDISIPMIKKMYSNFEKSLVLENPRVIQFGILFHQMKKTIENLKAKISELETQKVLLENDSDPNTNAIQRIDELNRQAKELLKTAVGRFENYSESRIDNDRVIELIAKYKAFCLEDRFYTHTINKSMMPQATIDDKFPDDIVEKYETYQELLGSIDKKEPGIKKYFNYMSFMRQKDEKARSNRYLIRMFEKEYEDNPIMATPHYQKGKNTKLDMSRYFAYFDLIYELPIKDYEIQEFITKSRLKERNDELEK